MLRVVIVDDEPLILEGMAELLRHCAVACEVTGTFANGALALAYLVHHHVDAVITDIKMPKMDGLTLMKTCTERGVASYFVVLSGSFNVSRTSSLFVGVNVRSKFVALSANTCRSYSLYSI